MKMLFVLMVVVLSVTGCADQGLQSYASEKPILRPDVFFKGSLESYGIFQDHFGTVVKRFTTKTKITWSGNRGVMHEDFAFTDGTKKSREWTLTKVDDHHYIGTAPDVIGQADGVVSGNTLHWMYDIILPVDGVDHQVTFNDWLYLVDEHHMFSKVKITKWGLPVGSLTMFFDKK